MAVVSTAGFIVLAIAIAVAGVLEPQNCSKMDFEHCCWMSFELSLSNLPGLRLAALTTTAEYLSKALVILAE